ncbi:CAZyme family GH76 [Paecilomyces variotii]|nr:CAZyme family GH76 [Paecilomyces variotii]
MHFFGRLCGLTGALWTALLAGQVAVADIGLTNINDPEQIKNAAATAAYDMMSYYDGNKTGQIPGKLPGTWWEGGAMFMTLIEYWYFTGDDSYNNVTTQGMLWQKGDGNDYLPSNWTQWLGNDDQVFWGLAAMTAAELNFPEQPNQVSWLALAQGVFNTQVPRWDTGSCGGGLRWQQNSYQAGWTTKNSISNGGLFQLSARLARYTNNQTYADWAEKIWDWTLTTPLMSNKTWNVADTTNVDTQCKDQGDLQWTYNYGTYISGAGYMYNITKGAQKWQEGIDGLLNTTFKTFFPQQYGGNIMSEVACEPNMMCDRNQDCFKGFLSSWLAFLTTVAPYKTDVVMPKLQASALAAAKQCSGGSDGKHCGRRWWQSTFDGTQSLETQMSATSIFSVQLISQKNQAPLTADTGGKSKGDPNAGLGDNQAPTGDGLGIKITTGDRAGAGIVTAIFLTGWVGMMTWMIRGG